MLVFGSESKKPIGFSQKNSVQTVLNNMGLGDGGGLFTKEYHRENSLHLGECVKGEITVWSHTGGGAVITF